MSESVVNVRYMVGDVQQSVDWYVGNLGFSVQLNAAPAFASVERGPLRLLLSGELPLESPEDAAPDSAPAADE